MLKTRTVKLTNINCEMESMAVYSALFAITNQFTADPNESSFKTNIWEFENQLDDVILGAMTSEQ